MSEKQVILAKTEYDAMERELRELRAILGSRTIAKIFVPYQNFRGHNSYDGYGSRDGIQVQYVMGTYNDKAIAELAAEVTKLNEKLDKCEYNIRLDGYELGRRADEINRLKKQTWYEKLFRKKQNP